jgi:hypothetical protein
MSDDSKPQSIPLTVENAEKILCTFVERAQNSKDRGSAFELSEADILVKSMAVVSGTAVEGINKYQARQNLVNGVVKGQRHGCYSLQDASSLWTVITYLVTETRNELAQEAQPSTQAPTMNVRPKDSEDLSQLSESVPLKLREI